MRGGGGVLGGGLGRAPKGPVEERVSGQAVPPVAGLLALGEVAGVAGDGAGVAAVLRDGLEELRVAAVHVDAGGLLVVADLGLEGADDVAEAGVGLGFPFLGAPRGTHAVVVDLVVGCWRAFLGLHPERGEEGVAVATATAAVQPEAAEDGEEGEAADDAADERGDGDFVSAVGYACHGIRFGGDAGLGG